MDWDKFDMNPRVIAAIKKANITSIKDIFHLSGSDLQRLTKLSKTDVQYLLRTISSTLRKNTVFTGAVYICTEDVFPNKRLQQLIEQLPKLRSDVPSEVMQKIKFGNRIFVEHAADLDTFHECITKRLSLLLSRGMVRLIIIDSIAALFRCEFSATDSLPKAKYLQRFGAKLHRLSSRFQTPIICINQVTDAMNERKNAVWNTQSCSARTVVPALGITWSNQLLMRLMVCRTVNQALTGGETLYSKSELRILRIIFAPHLPQHFCYYTVNLEGVKGIRKISHDYEET
ncbi:DNA repair protein XRCC3 isoform X2 [Pseudonaja textilis]|uniref:DNA repair protein XRCC3 isoform X2 n=1 Tax=Pseudonaja textilis TaxID=8673 RepID=UPI000EA96A50|nr:DNA repair protein XRCC3 isoform X2 [Pseudonaja textilis]